MGDRPKYPLEIACELADLGAQLVAERFRREHPDTNEAAVAAAVHAWWSERPGAEFGDAVGRPRAGPRS